MADLLPIEKRIAALRAKLEAELSRPVSDFLADLDDPEYKAAVSAYFADAHAIIGAK